MFRFIVLTCVIAATVSGQTTQVDKCTNHEGDLPLNTYIEGCINPPCILPQLQDAVINIVFKAPRVVRSMKTLATAYLNMGIISVPIPYDLAENAVTCNFLTNSYCPLQAGEVVQYTLRMYIESIFPVNTPVTIEFRVVDERSSPLLCIRTSLRIGPPIDSEALSNSPLAIKDVPVGISPL